MKTIFGWARRRYRETVSLFLITLVMATLLVGMAGCADRPATDAIEIRDWYDLAAISENITADYILMNDLDATTDGWEELASPTANDGKGWEPIGGVGWWFSRVFDGQGHEIEDLFINRPDRELVGLFGMISIAGVIRNVGVVNADITGGEHVGGLVGSLSLSYVSNSYCTGTVTGDFRVGGITGGMYNKSVVSNCYFMGSVTGDWAVGGLVGRSDESTVSESYATGTVFGDSDVGGLVGIGYPGTTISDSYSTGDVTGNEDVGGLAGSNYENVDKCYSTCSVTGDEDVGGLVGHNGGDINKSYSTGTVTSETEYAGGLVGTNYYSSVSNSYSTGSVTGVNSTGGLVGWNYHGTVSNSYSTGAVSGNYSVGGLVGHNQESAVSNSYSTGNVTGNSDVGGLVGVDIESTVNNSFWDKITSACNWSDGGIGRNTAEMQNINTFAGVGWHITTVANPGIRNTDHVWNIVDDETYPFLSWQPVS